MSAPRRYLARHAEARVMVTCFISECIHFKPPDIRAFAARFFASRDVWDFAARELGFPDAETHIRLLEAGGEDIAPEDAGPASPVAGEGPAGGDEGGAGGGFPRLPGGEGVENGVLRAEKYVEPGASWNAQRSAEREAAEGFGGPEFRAPLTGGSEMAGGEGWEGETGFEAPLAQSQPWKFENHADADFVLGEPGAGRDDSRGQNEADYIRASPAGPPPDAAAPPPQAPPAPAPAPPAALPFTPQRLMLSATPDAGSPPRSHRRAASSQPRARGAERLAEAGPGGPATPDAPEAGRDFDHIWSDLTDSIRVVKRRHSACLGDLGVGAREVRVGGTGTAPFRGPGEEGAAGGPGGPGTRAEPEKPPEPAQLDQVRGPGSPPDSPDLAVELGLSDAGEPQPEHESGPEDFQKTQLPPPVFSVPTDAPVTPEEPTNPPPPSPQPQPGWNPFFVEADPEPPKPRGVALRALREERWRVAASAEFRERLANYTAHARAGRPKVLASVPGDAALVLAQPTIAQCLAAPILAAMVTCLRENLSQALSVSYGDLLCWTGVLRAGGGAAGSSSPSGLAGAAGATVVPPEPEVAAPSGEGASLLGALDPEFVTFLRAFQPHVAGVGLEEFRYGVLDVCSILHNTCFVATNLSLERKPGAVLLQEAGGICAPLRRGKEGEGDLEVTVVPFERLSSAPLSFGADAETGSADASDPGTGNAPTGAGILRPKSRAPWGQELPFSYIVGPQNAFPGLNSELVRLYKFLPVLFRGNYLNKAVGLVCLVFVSFVPPSFADQVQDGSTLCADPPGVRALSEDFVVRAHSPVLSSLSGIYDSVKEMLSAAGVEVTAIRFVCLSATRPSGRQTWPGSQGVFPSGSWLDASVAVPSVPGAADRAPCSLESLLSGAGAGSAAGAAGATGAGKAGAGRFGPSAEAQAGDMEREGRSQQGAQVVPSWTARNLLRFQEPEADSAGDGAGGAPAPGTPSAAGAGTALPSGARGARGRPKRPDPSPYPYSSPDSISFAVAKLFVMRNIIERDYVCGRPLAGILSGLQAASGGPEAGGGPGSAPGTSSSAPTELLPRWAELCNAHPHLRPYKAVGPSIEFSKQLFREVLQHMHPFVMFLRMDVPEHTSLVRNAVLDRDILSQPVLAGLGPFRAPAALGKTLHRPFSLYLTHKIRDAAVYSLPVMRKPEGGGDFRGADVRQNAGQEAGHTASRNAGLFAESNPVAEARVSLDSEDYRSAQSTPVLCLLTARTVVGGASSFSPVELSHDRASCTGEACPLNPVYEDLRSSSFMVAPENSVLNLWLQFPHLFSSDALLYTAYVPLRSLFTSLLKSCVYLYGELQQPLAPVSDFLPYTAGVGLFYDPRDAETVRKNPTALYCNERTPAPLQSAAGLVVVHSFLFDYEKAAKLLVDRFKYDIVGGRPKARVSMNLRLCSPGALREVARQTRLSPQAMDKPAIVVADSSSIHLPQGAGRRLSHRSPVSWQPLIHQRVPRIYNPGTGKYEVDFRREISAMHLSCGAALVAREYPDFDSAAGTAVPEDAYRRACYSAPLSLVIGNADGDADGADGVDGAGPGEQGGEQGRGQGREGPRAWRAPENSGALHGLYDLVLQ